MSTAPVPTDVCPNYSKSVWHMIQHCQRLPDGAQLQSCGSVQKTDFVTPLELVHLRYWRVWVSWLQAVTGAGNSLLPIINQAKTLLVTENLYYNVALSQVGKCRTIHSQGHEMAYSVCQCMPEEIKWDRNEVLK